MTNNRELVKLLIDNCTDNTMKAKLQELLDLMDGRNILYNIDLKSVYSKELKVAIVKIYNTFKNCTDKKISETLTYLKLYSDYFEGNIR